MKELINSYKKIQSELNNYKELYLKEKQKSDIYKEQYETLKKQSEESEKFNHINDDNIYVDEIISQIQINDESNNILQNSINLVNYNKWKDETAKISQNYKDDLNSLKEAYKQKIILLHNSIFSYNQ